MPQDVFAIYNSLSVAQKQEVHDFMMFLSARGYAATPKNKSKAKRIGVAKGILNVPENIDADNAEIAKMFGA